jgi:putative phosphoesterase
VVLGNNDEPAVADRAPEWLEIDLDGLRIAMVHDSGPSKGRPSRLRRMFPGAAVVVFGHSHIPINEVYDGQLLFNPGSPTDRRRQPQGTMGELVISNGKVQARIIPVTDAVRVRPHGRPSRA